MFFASDNGAAAHPKIMEAVAKANEGYTSSYGADAIMGEVTAELRAIFEAPEAAVYLVATGTAANALSLACITQPWQTIFCEATSHVEVDECGAPEFYTNGAKLVPIAGKDGIMKPDAVEASLEILVSKDVHRVQRGSISITNVTECGTVYSLEEIQALTNLARSNGIKTHLDGARFANALVALGCSPADMTWKSGIDIVSFGGTKNGCLGVEAVIIFDPKIAWEFELRRKRGGHLFSKHRYLSAQMHAYLEDGLWLDMAKNANEMGSKLAHGLQSKKGAEMVYPNQANMIFAKWPRAGHRKLHDAGAYYYFWPFDQVLEGPMDEALSARLVCSWSTKPEDVETFLSHID